MLHAQNVDIITRKRGIVIGGVEISILNWEPLISTYGNIGMTQEEIELCESAASVRFAQECRIASLSQVN